MRHANPVTPAITTARPRPSVERIRELVTPRRIAVMGASNTSSWSHFTYRNLTEGGFDGDVWLVNRRGEPFQGRPTYTTLADVPGTPDLAVLLTGAHSIEAVLADCREKGIPNLIVLAGGFGEAGLDGAALQQRIVEQARDAGQLLLGPNNLGFINTSARTAAFAHMTEIPLFAGPVGVASQSGALSIYLIPYMASRGVGTSVCVTVGNEAMLSAVDVMDFLIDDPDTRVIAAYLEQIADAAQFVAVADRARAAGKPIVVFKAGRGHAAARVAAAHTGSLVGDDRVTDAVLRQLGVVRVDSIEQLVTTAGVLAEYGALPGPRAGFVTSSGAMCSVIAERADTVGIELPTPASETVAGLYADGMPAEAVVNNPLDLTGITANNPTLMARANTRFARDTHFDFVVITGVLPKDEAEEQMLSRSMAPMLAGIADSPVPMIPIHFLTTEVNAYSREFARRVGYPHTPDSCDRGIPALAHSVWWGRRLRELSQDPESPAPAGLARPDGADDWTEAEIGGFLREHGVPFVPARVARDADQAVAIADDLGYPVVLKIASADIAHKSDVGGVRLDLRSAEQVRRAFDAITASAREHAADARIRGVTVAPMRSGGVELLVGVVRDPQWGPVLALGLGGVFVEVLKDTALRRLPVGTAEIRRMLESLRGGRVLEGFRGAGAADLDAVAHAVHATTQVFLGLGDQIDELEINPLIVDGSRVEAVDALITWHDA